MPGQQLGANLVDKLSPALDDVLLMLLHEPHRFDDIHDNDDPTFPMQFGPGRLPRKGRCHGASKWLLVHPDFVGLVTSNMGIAGR